MEFMGPSLPKEGNGGSRQTAVVHVPQPEVKKATWFHSAAPKHANPSEQDRMSITMASKYARTPGHLRHTQDKRHDQMLIQKICFAMTDHLCIE